MAKRSGGLRFQPSGGARKPTIPVGKKQQLRIERMADDGRGISFLDGRTWFVSGALVGEEVSARALSSRGQTVEARTEQVLFASDLRQVEPCKWARRCGGCSLQHLPLDEQVALKQRSLTNQLQRQGKLTPQSWTEPLLGSAFDYRRRARIAVRWNEATGALDVGFRESASQAIVSIDDCLVLVPELRPLLQALPAVLKDLQQPQAIGHVELFHGDATAVLVRHTRALLDVDLSSLTAFCSNHSAQLWLQGAGAPEPHDPNVFLGYLMQSLVLEYRPGDFVQVNAAVNEAMVQQALDWLGPLQGMRVLDLFCGLGNFSLPIARHAKHVVGVEGSADMVSRAASNAYRNGLDNVHFFQADLSKPLADSSWGEQGYDIVLLDPPRDGAFEIARQIEDLKAERVLYISCNPATLARDAAELVARGYQLTRAGMMDMFPQTAHVEAMALFERACQR
jgi:23S rRNA (uracil1939-C5)-methyltransferase